MPPKCLNPNVEKFQLGTNKFKQTHQLNDRIVTD